VAEQQSSSAMEEIKAGRIATPPAPPLGKGGFGMVGTGAPVPQKHINPPKKKSISGQSRHVAAGFTKRPRKGRAT
jgi:hypothetical protein